MNSDHQAQKVRNAAYEFDRMAKKINRHLNQRSEMLSGISQDLRTPLTRLKLQLAMINNKISKNMSKDIDEMENMLNDYLQFIKLKQRNRKLVLSKYFKLLKIKLKIQTLKLLSMTSLFMVERMHSECFQTSLIMV